MLKIDRSRLSRRRHAMPEDVREALAQSSLLERYQKRPPYQQNDYLGWITRAKQDVTRQRRIAQMLQELARGDRYMRMFFKIKERS